MKDAARSRTTYYDLVREYLMVNHPRLFRVLLIMVLISLAGLAAFLVSDILSLGSNSNHSAAFAAFDLQGTREKISIAMGQGERVQAIPTLNASNKGDGSLTQDSGSIAKSNALNSSNSSRINKTTPIRTSKSSPGIRFSSGGGGSSRHSSKKNTAAKSGNVSNSSAVRLQSNQSLINQSQINQSSATQQLIGQSPANQTLIDQTITNLPSADQSQNNSSQINQTQAEESSQNLSRSIESSSEITAGLFAAPENVSHAPSNPAIEPTSPGESGSAVDQALLTTSTQITKEIEFQNDSITKPGTDDGQSLENIPTESTEQSSSLDSKANGDSLQESSAKSSLSKAQSKKEAVRAKQLAKRNKQLASLKKKSGALDSTTPSLSQTPEKKGGSVKKSKSNIDSSLSSKAQSKKKAAKEKQVAKHSKQSADQKKKAR